LYMASGQATEIAVSLMQHGLAGSTPVALVSNASLPNMQKVVTTLLNLHEAAQNAGSPALIILGEVLRAQGVEALPQFIQQQKIVGNIF